MNLNREENYKYRKLSLTILSKALDDICPTYDKEAQETKEQLIKERVAFFKHQERELDREWVDLEKEAQYELNQLRKDSKLVLKKIEKTRKTNRIKSKVKELKHKKNQRISYLKTKKIEVAEQLKAQLNSLESGSKKYNQAQNKLNNLLEAIDKKIIKSENRYKTIIENTLNSDNSSKVDERLEYSKQVWNRKYETLKARYLEKEDIYENKRYEQDQIRLAIQSFEEELGRIKDFCLLAGVSPTVCYTTVKERMAMIGRHSDKIEEILENLKKEGDPKPL